MGGGCGEGVGWWCGSCVSCCSWLFCFVFFFFFFVVFFFLVCLFFVFCCGCGGGGGGARRHSSPLVVWVFRSSVLSVCSASTLCGEVGSPGTRAEIGPQFDDLATHGLASTAVFSPGGWGRGERGGMEGLPFSYSPRPMPFIPQMPPPPPSPPPPLPLPPPLPPLPLPPPLPPLPFLFPFSL